MIEDLAIKHSSVQNDRPAGYGHISSSIRSLKTIPVSCGLQSSALSVHGSAGSSMSVHGSPACSSSTSWVGVVQPLVRAIKIGLLDMSTQESGNRLSCPHARLPTHQYGTSDHFAPHIAQKYAASLVQLACSLYCTAPQTAAAVLQQCRDDIWQSLIQMRSRRSIDCLYDVFPLLGMLYHTSSIELLLHKALAAAQSAGAEWYAKVCTIFHSASLALDLSCLVCWVLVEADW